MISKVWCDCDATGAEAAGTGALRAAGGARYGPDVGKPVPRAEWRRERASGAGQVDHAGSVCGRRTGSLEGSQWQRWVERQGDACPRSKPGKDGYDAAYFALH